MPCQPSKGLFLVFQSFFLSGCGCQATHVFQLAAKRRPTRLLLGRGAALNQRRSGCDGGSSEVGRQRANAMSRSGVSGAATTTSRVMTSATLRACDLTKLSSHQWSCTREPRRVFRADVVAEHRL